MLASFTPPSVSLSTGTSSPPSMSENEEETFNRLNSERLEIIQKYTLREIRIYLELMGIRIDFSKQGLFRYDGESNSFIEKQNNFLQKMHLLIQEKGEQLLLSEGEAIDLNKEKQEREEKEKKLNEYKKECFEMSEEMWTISAKRILSLSKKFKDRSPVFLARWKAFYKKISDILSSWQSDPEKDFSQIEPSYLSLSEIYLEFSSQLIQSEYTEYVRALHQFIFLVKKTHSTEFYSYSAAGMLLGGTLLRTLGLRKQLRKFLKEEDPVVAEKMEIFFMKHFATALIYSDIFNKSFDEIHYKKEIEQDEREYLKKSEKELRKKMLEFTIKSAQDEMYPSGVHFAPTTSVSSTSLSSELSPPVPHKSSSKLFIQRFKLPRFFSKSTHEKHQGSTPTTCPLEAPSLSQSPPMSTMTSSLPQSPRSTVTSSLSQSPRSTVTSSLSQSSTETPSLTQSSIFIKTPPPLPFPLSLPLPESLITSASPKMKRRSHSFHLPKLPRVPALGLKDLSDSPHDEDSTQEVVLKRVMIPEALEIPGSPETPRVTPRTTPGTPGTPGTTPRFTKKS